jgi:proline dehydrogenase
MFLCYGFSAHLMNILRPRVLRLYRPPPPFIGHVRRLTTAHTSPKPTSSSRFAIASAITLGSGYLIFSSIRNPALSEQHQPPLSAFTTSTPTSTLAELDDMGNRIAVRSKSTYDLWLSLGIYKACASSWIVNLAPHLISAAEKMGLSTPVYLAIKHTFFAYFCGGETADECIPVMEKLSRSGIGSILDLSIEADIDHAGDRQEYAKNADYVTELTLKSVGAASQENGMAAIKVTAFSSPMTLLSLNKWFEHAREEFASHMDQDGRINRKELLDITLKLSMGKSQVDLMPEQVTDVDWIDYMRLVSPQNPKAQQLMLDAGVSNEDLMDFKHCIQRLERVCDLAKTKHIKIMIDAEQSYFQRTIDHIAMVLQSKYNHRVDEDDTSMPVVLNTCKYFYHYDVSHIKKTKKIPPVSLFEANWIM